MMEMGKHHEVVVLTRSNNKEVIEKYFKDHPKECLGIEFIYFDLSDRLMKLKKRFNVHEVYYILWQRKARKLIDNLLARGNFDLVHLVTFASFRYPVFLNRLKVPVVWGPVGGAELAPWSLLWYRLRFPACLKEVLRNLATSLSSLAVRWVNPTRISGGRVIASTPRTQNVLRDRGIDAFLMPTIGVDVDINEPVITVPVIEEGLKLIFVGRLVLLKGVHFLLEGFAKADLSNAVLTIVGDGRERKYLERLAKELGIQERVHFLGQVEKFELPALYAQHHVVVAPSLYESGGYMVLEGFQQRRPAIVLDVGGPALSVDDSCGFKISQESGAVVVKGLATAMRYYADHPETIIAHGQAGFEKLCRVYAWEKKGMEMAKIYEEAVHDGMNNEC
jgi:glycosyltransferase involved in cell wall biosynthesis